MSKPTQDSGKQVTIHVSTSERPDFKQPLAAYVYHKRRAEPHRIEIRDGQFELPLPAGGMGHPRVLIAPMNERIEAAKPSADKLKQLGAYEPVLQRGREIATRIEVPGSIIDFWPFCFCWVHGKVVRSSDNRAVCNARVHICEVDRIPLWLLKLPDSDIFRLRDDLIEVLERPPIPVPGPGPRRATLRFDPQPEPRGELELPPVMARHLRSSSAALLRNVLADHWQLLLPWFCYWPHWWWLFRCDEMAVLTSDPHGNFETTLLYRCGGDHPDLYFWVEYDFGSGYEVVYRPSKACHTYWNYECGSEVTIRITDPRVPGCEEEPDLPGCQVVVLSIGNGVAVCEVQTAGASVEGLTNDGRPFGQTLEPRVDFSRTELIDTKGIPYYRWSYRRLSGPDGVSGVVAPGSEPLLAPPKVMAADVYRHYKSGTGYASDLMGPMATTGPSPAPLPNLFRIRPPVSPSGDEWIVLNEHIDLATAYFQTDDLAGTPDGDPPSDDMAAGRYEMRLELFDAAGALVNWTAAGIDLRITAVDAPFGTGAVPTVSAPAYNRILSVGGDTMGFRMVVRVDNNRCQAEIDPVGGTVSPDPVCGFHNYSGPGDTATLSFTARHPNNFATYSFGTARGAGPDLAVASISPSGTVGDGGQNGFVPAGAFRYTKPVPVAALLGSCPNAAFSEVLHVSATATNGYGELDLYDRGDHAAFALAKPCPVCG